MDFFHSFKIIIIIKKESDVSTELNESNNPIQAYQTVINEKTEWTISPKYQMTKAERKEERKRNLEPKLQKIQHNLFYIFIFFIP